MFGLHNVLGCLIAASILITLSRAVPGAKEVAEVKAFLLAVQQEQGGQVPAKDHL